MVSADTAASKASLRILKTPGHYSIWKPDKLVSGRSVTRRLAVSAGFFAPGARRVNKGQSRASNIEVMEREQDEVTAVSNGVAPIAPAASPIRGPRPLVTAWMRDIVISLVVSILFIIFLYQPVKVEGTSMMPTLADQERVFINKFVYKLEPISRGDVVVLLLSARYLQELHQARDRRSWRPGPHRRWRGLCQRCAAT